jgi:hypothetical protein
MAVSTQTLCYLNPVKDSKELARLQRELEWLLNKIETVKTTKLPYKPGAVREIRDLEYRAKRNELDLTFGGPEWLKYEKYAMWDLLRR